MLRASDRAPRDTAVRPARERNGRLNDKVHCKTRKLTSSAMRDMDRDGSAETMLGVGSWVPPPDSSNPKVTPGSPLSGPRSHILRIDGRVNKIVIPNLYQRCICAAINGD